MVPEAIQRIGRLAANFIVRCCRETRSDTLLRVHCFTTHFFSKLAKDGPKGVRSWTANQKLNIYSKKMIFVPVHENGHWSLCVVVNPNYRSGVRGLSGYSSFVYFLDSLGLHNPMNVTSKVVEWLNVEWERITGGGNVRSGVLEEEKTISVVTPTGECVGE